MRQAFNIAHAWAFVSHEKLLQEYGSRSQAEYHIGVPAVRLGVMTSHPLLRAALTNRSVRRGFFLLISHIPSAASHGRR